MLKDTKHHDYNVAFISAGFIVALLVFMLLYEILNRKLKPLKVLNRQIIEFSKGNKDIN